MFYPLLMLLFFCFCFVLRLPERAQGLPPFKKTADPADLNGRRKNNLKMILSQKNLLVYNLVCNVSRQNKNLTKRSI